MKGRENLYLVVIAGGSGTRFWPKSTSRRPKQLLSFGSSTSSLLTLTLDRFDGLVPSNQRLIVTTELLSGAVAEQVAPSVRVLAEPQGRNTAPCVYWAARDVAARDPKGVMLVMPADHYIPSPERFVEIVGRAADWALAQDDLITLGVQPSRPETGYGYLRVGSALAGKDAPRKVDAFVEKPAIERARQFLTDGNYLWNGGMFVWRADVILKAFDRHMPEMKKAWDESDGEVARAYPRMTATSIDYGVMEKAENVVSFELDSGWDDLGSWTSLEGLADVLGARRGGNVVSAGEAVAVESTGNIIDAPGKTVSLLGVDNLVIVQAGDAILVADKSRAQDIKLIVERIKNEHPELA